MSKIKNGLLLVTFSHTLKNGKDSCWFKFKEATLSYLCHYWRSKEGFRYLKIYEKLENGSCGRKIGYVTLDKSELSI
jgi:hypothetical protein